ncbi:uncharacterized protein L199_002658 [Kwoniella botswanensis]|uniref:uncharacterized protein n=1 Tax=Kwoniella botswanensis TaxID=1268659 RepID=UPI00315C724E
MASFPIYENGYLPGPEYEQDPSFLYDNYPTSPPIYAQEIPYEDEPYENINIQDSYVEYEEEEDELPEAWIPYFGYTDPPPGNGNQQVIIGAPFPQPSDLKQHYCDLYPEECKRIGGVLETNNTNGNETMDSDVGKGTGLNHVDLSGCGLALVSLLLILLGLNGGWANDKAGKDREGSGESDGKGGRSEKDGKYKNKDEKDRNVKDGKGGKGEDRDTNKSRKDRDRESSGKDGKGKSNREDRNKNGETTEESDRRKAAERAEQKANGKDGRSKGNKGETPEERAERKSREKDRQKNRNGETPEERADRKARDAARQGKDRDKDRDRDRNNSGNGKDRRGYSGETPEERQLRKDRERRDRNRNDKADRSNRETPEERRARKDREARGKDMNGNRKSVRSNRKTPEERQARKDREARDRDRGKDPNANNHKPNRETPEERQARRDREKDRKNGTQRSSTERNGQDPSKRSDRKENAKNETLEERAERHRREGRETPEERTERHRKDRENKDREKNKKKKNETPEERAERHGREGRETPEEREARHRKEREQKKGKNESPEERADRHRREGRETPQEKTDRLKKEKEEQGNSWFSPSMLLGLLLLLALIGFAGKSHIPQGMPSWNWRTPNLVHKPSGIIGGSLVGERGGLLGTPRSFVKGSPKVITSRSKWKVNEPAPHIHINNVNSHGDDDTISFGSSEEHVVVKEAQSGPVIVEEKIWEPIDFQFTGPTNPDRLLNMLLAELIVSLPLILDWIRDYPEVKYDQPEYISSRIQLLILAGLILFGLLIADWHFGWSTTMAPYAEVSVDSVQSGLTPVLVGAVETTEQLVWGLEDVLFGESRVLLGMGLAALGVFFLAQREPNLDIPSTEFSNYTTQALVFLGALLVGMLLWNA